MVKSKHFFDPVNPRVDFPLMERKLLDYWYKKGIVDKYLKKNSKSKKYFSFLDGPITANNPMGVHHGWGRTYKDLWQRYKNMRGYKQRFQNGFDCQGLWVEVEVEKELGLKNKREIENLVVGDKKASIAKFVQMCRERVLKFSKVQTEQSKRLGYFMDWDNSYYTMSDENNYMIWHFLKKCHENGWIYKGHESVPWCPRCETAISQHEMLTEDYKEVVHQSIYLSLPIEDHKDEYLLVWTTTPWTIPANIAVAVDKNLDYVLISQNQRNYWVAKDLSLTIFGQDAKIVKKLKGEILQGLKYIGPYDDIPAVDKVATDNPDKFHTVVLTDSMIMPISVSEGTGLVHTAVNAGVEDFRMGKKLGLPMIPVISDNADYLPEMGFLAGKNAKKHPEIILDYLKDLDTEGGNWVFKIENYKHRYPACWRCKTELVWKVADVWYISMDSASKNSKLTLRERMINVAKKIKWIPEFGLERELDWLSNMHDWLISKQNRYWGLALPIWECKKCGHFEVIGGKGDLKDKAIEGWEKFEGHTPHKPWIDEVKIKCEKCGEVVERLPDVGNVWLDAGIVPYSTITENNKGEPLYLKNKKKWKNWFPANFITESFPGQFKNWFYSMIAMSTVLENREPYKNVLGFGTLLGQDGRPMHKSWGNAIEFNEGADKIGVDVMRWIYVKQNPAQNILFGYKLTDDTRRKFHLKLWNVYNFFVNYANVDGWKPTRQFKLNGRLKLLDRWILSRLSETLDGTTKALEIFDSSGASLLIENFVDDLSNWYIRRCRERTGPVNEDKKDKTIFYQTTFFILETITKILAPFTPFISESIYQNLTKEKSVHLLSWPKFYHKSKEKLSNDMNLVRKIVEMGHSERKTNNMPVRKVLMAAKIKTDRNKLSMEFLKLISDELNVKDVIWEKGKDLKVTLDTRETPALQEESTARDLIRKIQGERKKLGIDLTTRVEVTNPWIPENKEILAYLIKKTLTTKISVGKFKVLKKKNE